MAKAKSTAVIEAGHVEQADELPSWLKFGGKEKAEALVWDWYGRFIRNSLMLIDGEKGNGKSTVAAAVAVALCEGRKLPGEKKGGPPGRCLWIGSEEGHAREIEPRWIAQGGTLDQLVSIDVASCRDEFTPKMPFEAEDLVAICKRINARVVVVDPWRALMSEAFNMFSSQQMRTLQEAWLYVAAEAKVSIIQLRHVVKDKARSAINAGEGSPQIGNTARVVMRVDPKPNAVKEWYLSTVVTNWGCPVQPVEYMIRGEEGAAGTLTFGKVADVPLDQIMQGVGDAGDQDAGREADRFLRLMLKNGPVSYKDLQIKGDESGLTRSMLRSAKVRCGVQQRFRRKGNKGSGHSEWFHPEWLKPAPSAPSAPSEVPEKKAPETKAVPKGRKGRKGRCAEQGGKESGGGGGIGEASK